MLDKLKTPKGMIVTGCGSFLFGVAGLLVKAEMRRHSTSPSYSPDAVVNILLVFFWIGLILILVGVVKRIKAKR